VLKSLGYFLFAAAGVTMYVHVRQHPDAFFVKPKHYENLPPLHSEPSGDIVIAPYRGGTLAGRWGHENTPTPSPTALKH
jgi:hypothetical protein